MIEPLKKSRTLKLARLNGFLGLIAATLSALPEAQQLIWLKQLVPGPFVVAIMLAFALALSWRRLSDQLDKEQNEEKE